MDVVLIVFLLLAFMFAFTSIYGAPWVPVRAYDVQKLLDDAKVGKGTSYLELGCGDGRLVRAAAQRGAKAVGYELNPLLFLVAWLRCLGVPNATVRFGDLWKISLSKADVVMAFLVPRTMPRLGIKAAKEMKPGALLVSYVFEIPGLKPVKKSKSWLMYSFGSQSK